MTQAPIGPTKLHPRAATEAYGRIDRGEPGHAGDNFTAALRDALSGVIQAGHAADAQATQAVTGDGADLTDVVTAIARAELALQTTVAVRDRVVQAYQDIMRMPI
jgi:flagellar hook-basal body complex protein FliE